MKTYIFYVNRTNSLMDMQRYNMLLGLVKEELEIKEYMKDGQDAEVGDRVFYVMLHFWDKGICACGRITDVRRRKGRFVASIKLTLMINPEEKPILPLKVIQNEISNFDWLNAENGSLLLKMYANRLEGLWNLHIKENNIGEEFLEDSLSPKANRMSKDAEAAFEEYGDCRSEADALYNYHCFLKACGDDLLDLFDVSYHTDLEYTPDEELVDGESNLTYEDPTITLSPKKKTSLGYVCISCRGFEFCDGHMIKCDVNTNNEKEGQECVEYIKRLMEVQG